MIIHPDLEAIKRAKEIAEGWLAGMGLELKASKTRITHSLQAVDGEPGFDFLGFNVRQYPRGQNRCILYGARQRTGFTPSIRPSKEAQKRFLRKIREIVRKNRAIPQEGLINLLNPIIRGWGHYFSTVVSKKVFQKMDHLIYWKLLAWAKRRHPKKSCDWVIRKYWLRGNQGGYSRFGTGGKSQLFRLSDIPIQRHVKVQGNRSPFDGDAVYWSTRAGKYPGLRLSISKLIKKQKGFCSRCGLFFKPGDQMLRMQSVDCTTGEPVQRWELYAF